MSSKLYLTAPNRALLWSPIAELGRSHFFIARYRRAEDELGAWL